MKKLALLAAALILGSCTLFASQEINKLKNPVKLPEIKVVSATGFEQNIVDAPASISVITSKEIEKASYTNIKDLLKNLAGVDIRSFGKDIAIRGMSPSYTLIMIDGKPLAGKKVAGIWANGIDINTLPPLNLVDRIEVIRGPMSSLYGNSAVGGTINIITKKITKEWSGSLSTQYNTFQEKTKGDHYNYGLSLAGPIIDDVLGVELNGLYSKVVEDKILHAKADAGDPQRETKGAGGKLSLAVSQKDSLSLGYQYSVYSIENFPFSEWFWDQIEKFTKHSFILDHEGKYDKLRIESYLKYDRTKHRATKIYDEDFLSYGEMSTLAFNTQGRYSFDKNILTLGLNYLDERVDTDGDGKVKRWNAAIFGEDDFFVTEDLTLTLGARLNKNEKYNLHFSPRAYGVYRINDFFTIKGGVSTGYINPGLGSTVEGAITELASGTIASIGNSKLKPESSINYEAGFVYSNEKINFTLMTFYSDFKDKLERSLICSDGEMFEDDTYTCMAGGKYYHEVYIATNLARLYSAGVEVSLDYQILSNLNLKSNYTYLRSKYKRGPNKGEITRQMPIHSVNLGVDFQTIDKLNLWTQIAYKSKEKDISYEWGGTSNGQPAHTVVELGAVYKINANLNINAGVYNLLNTNPGYLPWDEASQKAYFIEGRKYMIGFNARF